MTVMMAQDPQNLSSQLVLASLQVPPSCSRRDKESLCREIARSSSENHSVSLEGRSARENEHFEDDDDDYDDARKAVRKAKRSIGSHLISSHLIHFHSPASVRTGPKPLAASVHSDAVLFVSPSMFTHAGPRMSICSLWVYEDRSRMCAISASFDAEANYLHRFEFFFPPRLSRSSPVHAQAIHSFIH
ncbi:hypothetical protein MPTK1_3g03910 [Marchantia polymorpha subsp. ruderalis]|uniref:Uncharacterized protein n=2 Tax=Marchantia polymorpha TaxID=3197 RepID=A0AAF6AX73_MARPO|nr:hypothetical protein MARPO_0022s0140 [Marchantia polymorpha]BBN04357.1 hypothetical protein Mp_3g03910 [Marchantia polymorpha subsp. ruderalis]|eukprot:PTQ44047.1 hypothetical protein MARPO_0022s0140 [Marchantia polymorpha]